MSHLRKSQSAQNLVGSAHSYNLNYHRDTHAFDPSLIPEKSKQAAEEMRYLTSKDLLGHKAPEWNKSTYVDRSKYYFDQIPQNRLLFEFRTGLHDHHQFDFTKGVKGLQHTNSVKTNLNKIYQGTETRDNYQNWNVSTFIDKKEFKQRLDRLTEKSNVKTKQTNEALLKGYLKPPLAQTQFVKQIRDDKVADEDLRNKIREQYKYECPKSSEEKTAAEVFKRVAEFKLKAKQSEVASLNTADETFKPQLNIKKCLESFRSHDGAWSTEGKNGFWSCCMSEDFKSPGCIEKIRNKDRWVTISL